MTIAGKIESHIAIPDGVTVSMDGNTFKVKGPKGELSRNFSHPNVNVVYADGKVAVSSEFPRIKDKAMVGTYVAHINNMIRGVTVGFTYNLKVVFSHFPMKVAVNDKEKRVEVNNYMGGHAPRYAKIIGETKVKVSGADITVSGINIEDVGQTAANMEKSTMRGGFDKRVFEDGIYITGKSHKVKE
ncbi:MAG: 50S ribosomal protein L6 [Candidatus Methanomethylophilus sp.]|nr:50S ribosomal protein L6 [Methanomethylophilus sp.]MDD4221722.1 50S ribosomal protein L6 [Methanomethylophilus sp.]MDD4668430.1 50S ribosomal protein L6 [Methanomethylophilus sp.]